MRLSLETTTSSKEMPRVSLQRWPTLISFRPTLMPGVSASTMNPENAEPVLLWFKVQRSNRSAIVQQSFNHRKQGLPTCQPASFAPTTAGHFFVALLFVAGAIPQATRQQAKGHTCQIQTCIFAGISFGENKIPPAAVFSNTAVCDPHFVAVDNPIIALLYCVCGCACYI